MAWDERGSLASLAKRAKMPVREFVLAKIAEHGSMYMAAKRLGFAPNALRWQLLSDEEKAERGRVARDRSRAKRQSEAAAKESAESRA